jgi:acetyl-CoA acetyltransferase
MPGQWTVPLGEGAELIADKYAITRVAQDLHAYSSHTRAASAWADGLYAAEVVPVAGVDLARDETVRPEASLEAMDRLKPVSARTGRSPPATPRRSTTE